MADSRFAYDSRFDDERGSNPEELLAAAHAACFTMALSMVLGEAQLEAIELRTSAYVALDLEGGTFAITRVILKVTGAVPGTTAADFGAMAERARSVCPISKALKADILIETSLED